MKKTHKRWSSDDVYDTWCGLQFGQPLPEQVKARWAGRDVPELPEAAAAEEIA